MRNKYSIIFFLAGMAALFSCQKMDDYQKFQENGPVKYPGKVVSVIARPGDGKIMLQLVMGGDPAVRKARIFWNSGNDSMEVNVPAEKTTDTVAVTIRDIPESVIGFSVKTYDDKGNVSIPTNAVGAVYGPLYKSGLSARSAAVSVAKVGTILTFPENTDTTQYVTTVTYTNVNNGTSVRYIKPSVTKDTIADIKTNSMAIQTKFLPGYKNNAIDTFFSPVNTVKFNKFAGTYTEAGTLSRPGVADVNLTGNVVLTAIDDSTAWAQAGTSVFNNASIRYRIILDNDNKVTITSDPVAVAAGVTIGPVLPAATYDPQTKVFTLNYQYVSSSGAYRIFKTTLTLK